jgi:hypothetical protein
MEHIWAGATSIRIQRRRAVRMIRHRDYRKPLRRRLWLETVPAHC